MQEQGWRQGLRPAGPAGPTRPAPSAGSARTTRATRATHTAWEPVPYLVYGRLESWQAVALLGVLRAKGLASQRVEPSASLVLELAARTGREDGPYLRTPEGFVLAELHAMLDWLERVHPEPGLLPPPERPVHRICARILEAWIEDWLARRSPGESPVGPTVGSRAGSPVGSTGGSSGRPGAELERLAAHLSSSRFLLGPAPSRPDWLLATWLEAEVLVEPGLRADLQLRAPRLVSLASELFAVDGATRPEADARDDAIPLSLLPLLEEIANDHHPYLQANRSALEQGESEVVYTREPGRGRPALPALPERPASLPRRVPGCSAARCPARRESELRRVEIGRELAALPVAAQAAVRRVLDPVGARRVYVLPSALEPIDPADPRSI